ncbi:hypothetical protein CAPTEDRAFT_185142 [Capitella teleta]|uniref:Uncharacterized protein n=1 Tax=Capitella teleta TaxID=283909 RepID=R7TNF5_CAPTE|nr:hypothetical protein CAPTEDRAFT_185142 [Capitella teleta]|eukprot:ELT93081.1 hypothetical protein CAPTEDRAFT_185142 [Capitella teleta]
MQRNLPITMTTVLCTRLLRHFLRFATPLTNVMIVLLVFGLKEFLHDYGFRCECRLTDDQRSVPAERVAIGSLYIAVPAVTLWIVGVIMSRTTWRCLVGCGKQPACEYCGRRTACFFQTLAKSALAPIAWLFFVFLDGSYLECVMAPVPKHCAMNSTAASTGGAATDDSDDIVLISQIIALSLVAGSLLLYMLVTMVTACCSSTTYHHRIYGEEMKELENEAMQEAMREQHMATLKAKWKLLFQAGSQEDWINISAPESVDPAWQGKAKGVLFTPFQECTYNVSIPRVEKEVAKTRPQPTGSTRTPSLKRALPPIQQKQDLNPSQQNPSESLPPYDPGFDPRYYNANIYSVQRHKELYGVPPLLMENQQQTFGPTKSQAKKKKKRVKQNQIMDSPTEECDA